MALGGNAVKGRKMVPHNSDMFPSNGSVLFCAFSTIFPPLSEILLGNKTIHYFEDVDGQ